RARVSPAQVERSPWYAEGSAPLRTVSADSGRRRTRFRAKGEQDSGRKPNTFRSAPEWCSAWSGMISTGSALDINAGKGPFQGEGPLPARRMSMRKIKEVLRLRYELKLDQRQVARSCSIAVSTVHEYLKRAEVAKVSWPLPDGWDDTHVEAALYPCPESKPQPKKSPPDFAAVHEQLRTHRHVTLQLLWEEYREANPDGYRYSRYVAARFMFSRKSGCPACPVLD